MAPQQFTAADYTRMADELEALAKTIRNHPEMNHHTAERLQALVAEMREDANSEYLRLRSVSES